jgi:hypothetical protein
MIYGRPMPCPPPDCRCGCDRKEIWIDTVGRWALPSEGCKLRMKRIKLANLRERNKVLRKAAGL